MASLCPCNTAISFPFKFHNFIRLSSEPLTIIEPSWLKLTQLIFIAWASLYHTLSALIFMDNVSVVSKWINSNFWFLHPRTSWFAVGLKAKDMILVSRIKFNTFSPVSVLNIFKWPSLPQEPKKISSLLKATHLIVKWWALILNRLIFPILR